MFDGEFDDFFDLHDLLLQATDHVVGGIRYGFNFHEGYEGVDFGGQYFVQCVRVVPQCHPGVGLEIVDVNVFVDVDDIFPLRIDLYEHLFLPHGFNHFTDVGSGLLEMMELFAEHAHCGVEFISSGFEARQVGRPCVDLVG